jgi:hypothetical protein
VVLAKTSKKLIRIRRFHIDYVGHAHCIVPIVSFSDLPYSRLPLNLAGRLRYFRHLRRPRRKVDHPPAGGAANGPWKRPCSPKGPLAACPPSSADGPGQGRHEAGKPLGRGSARTGLRGSGEQPDRGLVVASSGGEGCKGPLRKTTSSKGPFAALLARRPWTVRALGSGGSDVGHMSSPSEGPFPQLTSVIPRFGYVRSD